MRSTADTIPAAPQILVTLEDAALLNKYKNAIKMFKGIKAVSVVKPRKRKTGLDEAIEDVKKGRVYYAEDSEDLFRQLGL